MLPAGASILAGNLQSGEARKDNPETSIWATNKKYHYIRLNAGFQSDIMWWHTFLASWNGVAIMPGSTYTEPTIEAYTDALGEVGCGAWWSHYSDLPTWVYAYAGK